MAHSVCEQDQQDAHLISFICFGCTILYVFRTNKFIIRRLLLYTQHIAFSTHVLQLLVLHTLSLLWVIPEAVKHAWKTLYAACTEVPS